MRRSCRDLLQSPWKPAVVLGALGLAAVLFSQQGCATIFAGDRQNVLITSNITGTTVKIAGNYGKPAEVKAAAARSDRMPPGLNPLSSEPSAVQSNTRKAVNITAETAPQEIVTPATVSLKRDADYRVYVEQNGRYYPCAYVTHYFKNTGYAFIDALTVVGLIIDLSTGDWFSLPEEVVCIAGNPARP